MPESQVGGGPGHHALAPPQRRPSIDANAVVGRWTGAKAIALRTASRQSQEAFAEQLGIHARTVAKWHQKPQVELRPVTSAMLDTVLRLASADVRERFFELAASTPGSRSAPGDTQTVDLRGSADGLSDDEDMLRRHFLLNSAAALTAVGLPGLADFGKAPRLSLSNVYELAMVTDAQRQLYHSMPARSMWSAVMGHLRLLVDLIRAPQPESVRCQLASLGGEAAGLLAWLAFDLGEERWRERMHDTALSLTAEANDRSLDAYVRGFRSQVRQLEGRPHAALALADQAVATATPGQGSSVHAWLKGRQAAALAELGDGPASMAALTEAEDTLSRGGGDEPAWMYQFDLVRLTAVRGDCLLRLDQPVHAERAFQHALVGSSHEDGRRFRVELLTGKATAVARQGRVDEACGLGMQSLDLAASGSDLGIGRVRQLRRELDRWHDLDEVAALDGRLGSV